ncbi:AAA family ATPase [Salmonella enterica subsp. enterica]|nr:AAA family ATPase [Salmonella enterica subsp. enterica]EKE2800841.1 AAA family ATPase [Salmonella enterica]EIP2239746.1 AAA family ATPase [Salmonella enterica subsp. enterica]EIR2681014.1 AAA family ATPase [Salmonella enterica subsp. enterica]EIS1595730.1 AAA family ATPase [Salmonella enterica subsp. enterica]
MTTEYTKEQSKATRSSRNLKNLYLDPNNYRFVDNENHKFVTEDNILDPQVQKRSRTFIEGKGKENIRDLIASFKANGFLDVDRIQARELGDNKYLVLEGNRRVTALKALQEDFDNGYDIGNLDPAIFRSVPFEIHSREDNEKHLIVMGLKHISGNKKWSTYNQSKLLYDFLKPYENKNREEYVNKENELVNSLGITKHRLRSMLRVFNLIQSYKLSEYSEQFSPSMVGIFEETMKKPIIKNWLGWNDSGYFAENKLNLERFFSWISTTEEYSDLEEDEESEEHENSNGDEYNEIEPIITKSLEIRDLALFIDNENAIKVMEDERSLARGLVSSGSVDKQNYQNALSSLTDSLNSLINYRTLVSVDDTAILDAAKEKLLQITPKKSSLNIEGGNYTTVFEFGNVSHFKNINIIKYKKIKKFQIDNLNRINIFAGFNNTGKTSLLEAVYLLTQRNDIGSHFKMIGRKNKCFSLSPVFLNSIFQDIISVEGQFNNIDVSIFMEKFDEVNIDKKDDYIASYKLISKVDTSSVESTVHTFIHERMQRIADPVSHLCASSFKSPYFQDIEDTIIDYNKSVELKVPSNNGEYQTAINMVIEFMRSVENTIIDIRYVEEMDIGRFLVDSQLSSDRNFDLTSYGEGIQRIFNIALSFASCRNGVLLIDEFETAIHFSLLKEFTKLTQKLAEIFNVQLFITSHSNECIRAFIENGYRNDCITGFRMLSDGDKVTTKRVDGDRFQYLIENIDLDIRG